MSNGAITQTTKKRKIGIIIIIIANIFKEFMLVALLSCLFKYAPSVKIYWLSPVSWQGGHILKNIFQSQKYWLIELYFLMSNISCLLARIVALCIFWLIYFNLKFFYWLNVFFSCKISLVQEGSIVHILTNIFQSQKYWLVELNIFFM